MGVIFYVFPMRIFFVQISGRDIFLEFGNLIYKVHTWSTFMLKNVKLLKALAVFMGVAGVLIYSYLQEKKTDTYLIQQEAKRVKQEGLHPTSSYLPMHWEAYTGKR